MPTCSNAKLSGWPRPWKKDPSYCIPPSEILAAGADPEVTTIKRGSAVIFTKLPVSFLVGTKKMTHLRKNVTFALRSTAKLSTAEHPRRKDSAESLHL